MAKSSETGGRQTKAQRREAARLQREQIQRKMAAQRRNRRIGFVAAAVVAVIVVAVVAIAQPFKSSVPAPDELLKAAPAAVQAAGCGEVATVDPYQPESNDQTHLGADGILTPPGLSTYPSTPPASGPHNPQPLPAGIYSSPPQIDQAIHSLEHGAAIIWYDPSAIGPELDELKTFYREYLSSSDGAAQGGKFIVAPYDYPDQGAAGRLPEGTQMAVVAWHHLQTCAEVSLPVAFSFTSQYVAPPFEGQKYKGDAPEPQSAI